MIQLLSRCLCLCLCICVPYSFLNSYYHKLSENVWVLGSGAYFYRIESYLIFVISFTRANFLESKIYTLSCDFEVLILDLDTFSCDFLLFWICFLVIFGIWSLCIRSSGHFMKYIIVFAQICDSRKRARKKQAVIKTMKYINIYFTILIQTVC